MSAKISSARTFGGQVRGGHVRGGHVRGGHVRGGHVRGGHVRGGHVRGGHVRGGLMSAADNSPPKALADDILADLSASPRRIRRESARIRLDPPRIRRDPPDVRRTSAKKNFWRTARGSARIRGGQVSATYRAKIMANGVILLENQNQLTAETW